MLDAGVAWRVIRLLDNMPPGALSVARTAPTCKPWSRRQLETVMAEPAGPQRVSVIIAARNAAMTLGAQLQALSRQNFQGWWELIVVDNGSSDDTADVAKAWQTNLSCLRVVNAPAARGVGGTRNAGAAAARGDVLLFCDADDIAAPTWLGAMASAARAADIVGGYRDFHTLNTPRTRFWCPPILGLPIKLGYLPYAPGSCLGVRAEVSHSLSGFNEDYVGAGEDVEFC
jgi:glycosyltransferase involved in cell wall biosynthesis